MTWKTSTFTAVWEATRRRRWGVAPRTWCLDRFTESDVKTAVESLPEAFRLAVLLADVEGFSYKEIAEILEVPIGTVMSRLHRGRRALEKALATFAGERRLTAPADVPT